MCFFLCLLLLLLVLKFFATDKKFQHKNRNKGIGRFIRRKATEDGLSYQWKKNKGDFG
jgi:hypothetical protein